MKIADFPADESERLQALINYDVLDTEEEETFDELTELASLICDRPIALVSLIDKDRQWFKSHHGLDARETKRDYAFCAHAILGDDIFEISDSRKDKRFVDNPLSAGEPHVIAYAGTPLKTPDGYNIGTLCVIDHKPGELSNDQQRQLTLIGKQVVAQLELRKNSKIKTELLNELKKISNSIQKQNQELYQFSHRAAHDLKAPLSNIQSFIDLSLSDLDKGDIHEAKIKFDFVKAASVKAQCLINDLMSLTKAELDIEDNEKINFEQLINDVILSVKNAMPLDGVDISYEIDCSVEFKSQKIRLNQILYNLLSNSVKYSDPQKQNKWTKIFVTTTTDGASISVEDNGLGIPEKYQHKIFDTFTRFHANKASGSGLGTTIVKKHVDSLSGTIDLISDSEKTIFAIHLPA